MYHETTPIGYWLAIVMIATGAATHVPMVAAAEIAVLSPNTVKSVLTDLVEAFQRETGHSVRFTFDSTGAVEKRTRAGEATDIVIVTEEPMEQMSGEKLVLQDARSVIGRVGVGVGVREGAPKPDISSTDTFRQTLLSAKSITYSNPAGGGASAMHFSRVIERLGISQAIKEKAVLGGGVCERVTKGEVELCVTQISEILPVKGVRLLGPLPPDIQRVTTLVAAISTRSSAVEAALEFLKFLARPSSRTKFAEGGLEFR